MDFYEFIKELYRLQSIEKIPSEESIQRLANMLQERIKQTGKEDIIDHIPWLIVVCFNSGYNSAIEDTINLTRKI